MIKNPVIDAMMARKSIRKYTDQIPSDETLESIVLAAQQAPFAGQMCSLLLSRKKGKIPFGAPLLFTVCLDTHKLEIIMARRGWTMKSHDTTIMLFGMQDAILMAENLVIAGESVGMGSCFLGNAPYRAQSIIRDYSLPPRVLPIVQLAMGYPDEDPPTRPRYPIDYFLFEDSYPKFTDDMIERAAKVMDDGYLAQDYYRRANYMVALEDGREEKFTYDDYSWIEHMCRKWGQWYPTPDELLEEMAACGFCPCKKGDD